MTEKLDIVGIGNAMVDAIIPSNRSEIEKNKDFKYPNKKYFDYLYLSVIFLILTQWKS